MMGSLWVGARTLLRSRDRATSILTVLAFALPHAFLLAVAGGVSMFYARFENPANSLQSEGIYPFLAAFAAVLLIVPVLTMGAAAARLGLSRRAKTLAILRLMGLQGRQAKSASVIETVIHAGIGVVVGTTLYALTLPMWGLLSFQNTPLSVGEMWVGPLLALGLGATMIVLSIISAWFAMRRVALTPLGVARSSEAERMSPIGLILGVVLVVGWLSVAQIFAGIGPAVFIGMTLGFLAAIFAVTNVIGSLCIAMLGRLMVRVARRPHTLLAGRRIMDDPKAVWRSYGSVALIGFVVGVLYPIISVLILADDATMAADDVTMFHDILTGIVLTLGITFVLAAISATVNQSIRVIDGVGHTRALIHTGASTRFLDASRRIEVAVPALVTSMGSLGLGLLFMLPMGLMTGGIGVMATTLGFGILGVSVILLSAETTRPLRTRLLREPLTTAA